MARDFTRSLGFEPGVQLNPTVDNSQGFAINAVEQQTIAGVLRLPRGYIDRAFEVHSGNVLTVTGIPEPIRRNPLNAAHVQLLEAVNSGAKRALITRLVGADAKIKWIVVKKSDTALSSSESNVKKLAYTVQDTQPTEDFIFAIKHLGCFNDGIKLSVSAKEVLGGSGGTEKQDATVITLKITDKDDKELNTFVGSLDLNAVDADGYPADIASVIANFAADDYEMVISAGAKIEKDTDAYGKNASGIQRVSQSGVLQAFDEGTATSFSALQYKAAVKKLLDSETSFVQATTFGSDSTALCAEIAKLAFEKNITCGIDVPNNLNAKQAIAWVKQLGLRSHLLYCVWHPVECRDPAGINGRVQIGTSALRSALIARRNAAINALGFAPKQYVVAGVNYPVQRQGMKQLYKPDQEELSDLALHGITPVIYETFSGGGYYVFNDSITMLGKNTSTLNLLSSVEIVTEIERSLSRIAREFLLFLPMQEAIRRTLEMGGKYLDNARISGWLTNSQELGGKAWELEVQPNAQRPADTLNIRCRTHPEGSVRQVIITSEVTR